MSQKIDNQTFFTHHQTPHWKNPPMVVAWQLTSAQNLGALLRVCDNFGVQEVFFVGEEKDYKHSKIKRNATTAIDKLNWKFISAYKLWQKLPPKTLKMVVDTTSTSVAVHQYCFDSSKSYCLFFGNETTGLANEVVQQCDASVHIPMIGTSFSMNVVQCAAVVLYELTKQCVLKA